MLVFVVLLNVNIVFVNLSRNRMVVDVFRVIGEVISVVCEFEGNRLLGVVYVKCVLKYFFGGVWVFGIVYIFGKYNVDFE